MANNRCFTTSNNTIQNASDYSTALKQKTIFKNIAQNMNLVNNANPEKKDGYYYNSNFGVVPLTNTNQAGCLINSSSYELLLDVTKGESLYNTENGINVNATVNDNEAWAGNLFSVNYAANNINIVVDTSFGAPNTNQVIYPQPISASAADFSFNNSYPGIIVDPSYNIFYNPCLTAFNDGKNPWLHLVDVSYNNSSYYQTAVKNNPFYNFSYPQKVLFACRQVELSVKEKIIIVGVSNGISGYWINNSWNILTPDTNYNVLDISSDGSTMVGTFNGTKTVGGYWNGTNYQTFNTLSDPSSNDIAYYASGASSNGSIIVGYYQDPESDFGGYWINNVWSTLSPPPLSIFYRALGISSDGSTIVGSYSYDLNTIFGGYWNGTNYQTFNTLPDPFPSSNGYYTSGASSNGSIIVGYYITSDFNYFVGGYWINNVWTTLPLPNGAASFKTTGISSDGSIISGYYNITSIFDPNNIAGYWQKINDSYQWNTLTNPTPNTGYIANGVTIISI